MKEIKFKARKADNALIGKIVDRAMALYKADHKKVPALGFNKIKALDVIMDITATHLNGCPLNLEGLLAADNFNFMHDIHGIGKHLDRNTGTLMDCFLPRFAKKYTSPAIKAKAK